MAHDRRPDPDSPEGLTERLFAAAQRQRDSEEQLAAQLMTSPPAPPELLVRIERISRLGPATSEEASALLSDEQALHLLKLQWSANCPPAALIDAAGLQSDDGFGPAVGELLRRCHHAPCADCGYQGVAPAANLLADGELRRVLTTWSLDAESRAAASRSSVVVEFADAHNVAPSDLSGEIVLPELADAGFEPRVTWEITADPPALLIFVARIVDHGYQLEVSLGGESPTVMFTEFDRYGDLRAEVPLDPSFSDESINITFSVTRSPRP